MALPLISFDSVRTDAELTIVNRDGLIPAHTVGYMVGECYPAARYPRIRPWWLVVMSAEDPELERLMTLWRKRQDMW